MTLCSLNTIVAQILQIYVLIMLAYAVLSWVPSLRQYAWTEWIARLVEPVLMPVRRIVPPIGGLDLSFLVVIIILQFVAGNVRTYSC